jgi:DNA-binding GntR family transcriptional regulator
MLPVMTLVKALPLRQPVRYRSVAQARGKHSWDEHAELIRATAAGGAEGAGRIMSDHTERARRVTPAPAPRAS